ncbi:MAG TPA: hypothetical protein VG733_11460 [Chthoniobacteraceae bacterium]|nr:hypothetical protein [Chthoniobacteraceae bacterium]
MFFAETIKAIPLLAVAFALSACCSTHAPTDPALRKLQPAALSYSFEGYNIDSIDITWDADHLVSTCVRTDTYPFGLTYSQTSSRKIHPTATQWAAFWNEMDAIEVWRWLPDYTPRSPAIDGGEWKLTLSHNGQRIDSGGLNGFPSDDNPRKISDLSARDFKRYKRLRDALEKLTGTKL